MAALAKSRVAIVLPDQHPRGRPGLHRGVQIDDVVLGEQTGQLRLRAGQVPGVVEVFDLPRVDLAVRPLVMTGAFEIGLRDEALHPGHWSALRAKSAHRFARTHPAGLLGMAVKIGAA